MMNYIGVGNNQQHYKSKKKKKMLNLAIRAKYFIFRRRNKIGFILFCFVFLFDSFLIVCLFVRFFFVFFFFHFSIAANSQYFFIAHRGKKKKNCKEP